jgi:hypothetical protein
MATRLLRTLGECDSDDSDSLSACVYERESESAHGLCARLRRKPGGSTVLRFETDRERAGTPHDQLTIARERHERRACGHREERVFLRECLPLECKRQEPRAIGKVGSAQCRTTSGQRGKGIVFRALGRVGAEQKGQRGAKGEAKGWWIPSWANVPERREPERAGCESESALAIVEVRVVKQRYVRRYCGWLRTLLRVRETDSGSVRVQRPMVSETAQYHFAH